MNGAVRINFPAGGEDESSERAPPSSLAAKPARFEGCSQSTLIRPPFCLQLDMGQSILKPGVLRTLKTEVEKSFM